ARAQRTPPGRDGLRAQIGTSAVVPCSRGPVGLTWRWEPEARIPAVLWLRSVFFTLVLPGSVLLWVPLWISTQTGGMLELGAARWIGLPVLIIGVGGLLWCIWDFGRRGKGTLAPVDPPRFVVRGGLYRCVRN